MLLGWTQGSARAQSAPTIELHLPTCVDASWHDALVDGVRLELLSDGAELGNSDPNGSDCTRIELDLACSPDPKRAQLKLHRNDRLPLERDVELSDVPATLRTRTLALALAELWRSSRASSVDGLAARNASSASEPDTNRSVAGRPEEPITDQHGDGNQGTPRDSPNAEHDDANQGPHGDEETRISVAPALRVFFAAGDVLPGAQLALGFGRWRTGIEGFYGWTSDPLGDARYGLVHAFISWDAVRHRFGANGISLGARAAVGGTFASATATTPARSTSSSDFSGDAAAELAWWRNLNPHWSLSLRLQSGYAFGVKLASDTRTLADLHGIFVSSHLALATNL